MSLHYHPQSYRYRSASRQGGGGHGPCEQLGSDSDVNELSELEDDEEADEEEDGDEGDGDEEDDEEDEDEDEEEDEEPELPYPGFVPVALRYLDQETRPRNWCLALITNPYPLMIPARPASGRRPTSPTVARGSDPGYVSASGLRPTAGLRFSPSLRGVSEIGLQSRDPCDGYALE